MVMVAHHRRGGHPTATAVRAAAAAPPAQTANTRSGVAKVRLPKAIATGVRVTHLGLAFGDLDLVSGGASSSGVSKKQKV